MTRRSYEQQPTIYHKELQVIQYNTNRSRDQVMATFLRDPKVRQADVIAIQEPWNNPHHPANQTYLLRYPKQEETQKGKKIKK